MGAHHSVGSVTGAMTPCSTRRSISFSLYIRGTVRGVVTQNERYAEFLTGHGAYLAVEYRWELRYELFGSACNRGIQLV